MGKRIDLTGCVFGRLTVLEPTDKRDSSGSIIWKCQCSCEKHTICYCSCRVLRSGEKLSCGCLKIDALKLSRKDITGKRIGRLVAIEPTEKKANYDGSIIWKCQCDCGNITYASIHDFNRQHKLSCGCMKSKGESLCKQIFNKNNIFFQEQYQFENCVNPKTSCKLLFDFYLPDYNCCVEYDGVQHYIPKGFSHDDYDERVYRDTIKNEFCFNNDICLIRIPYTQYDKLSILDLLPNISTFILRG